MVKKLPASFELGQEVLVKVREYHNSSSYARGKIVAINLISSSATTYDISVDKGTLRNLTDDYFLPLTVFS